MYTCIDEKPKRGIIRMFGFANDTCPPRVHVDTCTGSARDSGHVPFHMCNTCETCVHSIRHIIPIMLLFFQYDTCITWTLIVNTCASVPAVGTRGM